MTEREPTVDSSSINDIPSDIKSPWVLNFEFKYDVFMQFTDSIGKTGIFFPPIRFRRSGGPFFLIAEEFAILQEAFENNKGQVPEDYKKRKNNQDIFPSYVDTTFKIGTKPDESKYIIKGIPDGDVSSEDNNKLMDIEITKGGNAVITMRDIRHNNQASIEFKTAENGGRYPIMAAVFTRIAERITKAKKIN
jgi:hypothetical protein